MSVTKINPKKFLGATLAQSRVLSTKVDEIIDQVNTNETDVASAQADIDTINSFDTADVGKIKTVKVTLTATEIVGNAAGDIGHADGAVLVAAPGAGYALQFLNAVLVFDYATAAYTGGADDATIRIGTVAQTAALTDANYIKAAGDKVYTVFPISTAETSLPVNSTINLKGTAYTQPGTAAGVLRCYITYRVVTTNL
jgi:hypothetical protein